MAKEKQQKEKPLEKMTATELREVAKEIPDIVGASGMNKLELISAIKKARGIVAPVKKRSADIRKLKRQIKDLRKEYEAKLEADDELAAIWRRKIIRLKKKPRRSA